MTNKNLEYVQDIMKFDSNFIIWNICSYFEVYLNDDDEESQDILTIVWCCATCMVKKLVTNRVWPVSDLLLHISVCLMYKYVTAVDWHIHNNLPINKYVSMLTNNKFSSKDILKCELAILETLNYDIKNEMCDIFNV